MHIDIVSLSLREFDALALATNATVSMKRDTRRPTERNTVRTSDFRDGVENLCIIRANTPDYVNGPEQTAKVTLAGQS